MEFSRVLSRSEGNRLVPDPLRLGPGSALRLQRPGRRPATLEPHQALGECSRGPRWLLEESTLKCCLWVKCERCGGCARSRDEILQAVAVIPTPPMPGSNIPPASMG